MKIVYYCASLTEEFCSTQLTVIDWKLFSFKTRNYIFVELKNCFKNTNNAVYASVELFPEDANFEN